MSSTITDSLDALKKDDNNWSPPKIFSLRSGAETQELEALLASGSVRRVLNKIDAALTELYDIANPSKKDSKTDSEITEFIQDRTEGEPDTYGVWVYYPWTGNLVHFPPVEDLRALRTVRNYNLVTAEEHQKLYGATILIAGLSVGSNVTEMLLSQGIGGKLILVDMDVIDPSNLNRIKTVYSEVGVHKVDVLAKRISETDPFIEQVHIKEGLTEANLTSLLKEHDPDVLVDEIDDLRMKLKVRDLARQYRKPVIMATDNGDNAILDIERYDTDRDQQAFEGRIPDEILTKIQAGTLSRPETGVLIGKYFVGTEHIPLRMFESLMEVGKTIPSWPQLASAATMSGVLCAYATKKIVLGQPLHSGRHLFDIDASLDPLVTTKEYKKKTNDFIARFFS